MFYNSTAVLDISPLYCLVSKLLGHKNLRTTQIYARVLPESKVSAIGKLNSIDQKGIKPKKSNQAKRGLVKRAENSTQ